MNFFSFAALHTGILGGSPKLGWWKDEKKSATTESEKFKSWKNGRLLLSNTIFLFFIFNNRGILSLPIWYYSAALANGNFHGLQPMQKSATWHCDHCCSSLAEMCQTRKQCMVASEPRSKLNKMFKIQRNKIEFNSVLKKHLLDDVKESYTGTCSRLLCPQCHLNLN